MWSAEVRLVTSTTGSHADRRSRIAVALTRVSGNYAVLASEGSVFARCAATLRLALFPAMNLFRDRADAGRQLAAALDREDLGDAVVVGLARGGVEVAAEVARALSLPLDVVAVRKIGHPWQPEYGIGAVTPGDDGVYVRSHDGVSDAELKRAVEQARSKAQVLDRALHENHPPVDLAGRTALLVDDGLATGATMVASIRWARSRGAARVVVAVPVGAAQSLRLLRDEADIVVCPHAETEFWAVGLWYDDFRQVSDEEVLALLDASGR